MPTVTKGRCSCGKYERTSEDIDSVTTRRDAIHCFDGTTCVDIRAYVDQCVYSSV